MIYKVFKCELCKSVGITSSSKRFKCLNCGKSRKIELEPPKYKSDNPLIAREFLIKYNKELRTIKAKI